MQLQLQMEKTRKIYDLNQFEVLPEDLIFWAEKESDKKVLVLHGPSGTGKTQLSKSIAKNLLKKEPFLVSDINSLRDLKKSESVCIIFDDINTADISRETLIHLLDVEETRQIRILYGYATIQAGTTRIFTTNKVNPFISEKALERRGSFILLKDPCFKPKILPARFHSPKKPV